MKHRTLHHIEPIPPSIVKAVTHVTGALGTVAKDGTNEYDQYDFTSTDNIYSAASKPMAEVGLAVICLEAEPVEVATRDTPKGKKQWGRFVFQFVLACGEDTWTDATCRRTLFIEIARPTSFMAAQSYAEKSFLRSLFKIATGDPDIEQLDDIAPPKQRRSKASLKAEGGEFDQWKERVAQCSELTALADEEKKAYSTFPKSWHTNVAEEVERKKATLLNGFI